MIAGIGVDMIEVKRVKAKIVKERGFREQTFSAEEIEYCENQQKPFLHYAARFCVKEAFLKAAGVGFSMGFALSDIIVATLPSGQPHLQLQKQYINLAEEQHWKNFHVSISHLASIATAIVIIEK
ncbi:MAG: holo-ACP synthase [Cyclobacteriaceae bacterium]